MMKKMVLSLLCAFMMAVAAWADTYQVSVRSALNLRATPSTTADIVCKIPNEALVTSDALFRPSDNEWVAVQYQGMSGYVKSGYLIETTQQVVTEESESSSIVEMWQSFMKWEGNAHRWLAYVIIAMALLMWAECKFVRELDTDFLEQYGVYDEARTWAWPNALMVIASSVMIFYYVMKMGSNSLWFLMPSDVGGWLVVAFNFVIFVYVFIDLVVFFMMTLKDLSDSVGVKAEVSLGLLTWVIGIICVVPFLLFDWNLRYLALIVVVLQGIQLVMLFSNFSSANHVMQGVAACAVYAIGSFALVLLASCLFVVMVMIAVVCLVCYIISSIAKDSGVEYISYKEPSVAHHEGQFTEDAHYDAGTGEYYYNSWGAKEKMRRVGGNDIYENSKGEKYRLEDDKFRPV